MVEFLWSVLGGFGDFWGGILLNLSVVEFFGVWLGFFGVFGGGFVGIFGACSTNSAKFAQTLAI